MSHGSLHRLHRGVYAVGHMALAPLALEQAALLACGPGAVLSHATAAHLWGLVEVSPQTVDVTIGRQCRLKTRIRIHRVPIERRDVRRRAGLPVTSPARTLIDLAAHVGSDELERLVAEARVRHLVRDGELEAAAQRAGRGRGAAAMRAFLNQEQGPAMTRSKAERIMRRLARDARIPQPKTNARVAGMEVDFLWEKEKVIVEVDGWQFHGHRRAFERDRRKDMLLTAAGYLVIRISWRQLTEEPLAVAAHLAKMLDRRRLRSA